MRLRARALSIGLSLILLPTVTRGRADDHVEEDVSPSASTPWRAPDLSDYAKALRTGEAASIDPQTRYDLPELVDLAERLNPETRVAWEKARQAAIAVGLVQSEYAPILSLNALGGYHSEALPAPKDVAPSGFFRTDLEQVRPTLSLEWLLLDFGRRESTLDAAKQRLLAANLGFNRKHQEVVYRVRHAFVSLASLNAKIAVAQSALDSARAVRDAAESQLENGLATMPEVALARQQEAQAAFDLEDVSSLARVAQVRLADGIGVSPTTPIQLSETSALPAPAALEESVEAVIDRAFEQRPDLIARVAALRASEAEVRRARTGHYPTLALVADLGLLAARVKITGGNQPTGWFSATEPGYGVGLALRWNLLEGGATRRRVELAESARRAAESEVAEARDRAVSDVWTAYTDVKLAVRRLDTATALVTASQQSYEATLESHRQGLETLTNLLVARRELSRARFVELDTRLQLFDASAALAFSTGEAPPPAAGTAGTAGTR
jgi:outer membrane protein